MSNIPFRKFIIMFLFFNKDIAFIINKLKSFGCYTDEKEVIGVFNDIKTILPENIKQLLDDGIKLDATDAVHVQWLKHYEVFEFYDYLCRKDDALDVDPVYFKWCDDCIWIHNYKDVVALINIFLYNNEPLDSVSKIVKFKYNKKIGVDALKLYTSIFWDCQNLTAKDAWHYCLPFRNNVAILRTFRNGEKEISMMDDNSPIEGVDGCDMPVTFHDAKYIKWKIGYKDNLEVPDIKDFMQKVMVDSMYKYEEVMMMTSSDERENEHGIVAIRGENGQTCSVPVDKKKKTYRNVEENRARLAKSWTDMVIKAHNAMPVEGSNDSKKFLEEMKKYEIDYEEPEEKMVSIDEVPGMLSDIKGDM